MELVTDCSLWCFLDDKKNREQGLLLYRRLFTVLVVFTLFSIFSNWGNILEISWNDFVNEMLAKGEVARVEVDPEKDCVYVHLFTDAVLVGQTVSPLN